MPVFESVGQSQAPAVGKEDVIAKRKLAVIVTWLAGILSFVVSYLGLMAFAFTPPWEGRSSHIVMVAGVLVGVTMLVSFPVFLLFLRWHVLAILLQWSAVIVCIASVDLEDWGRSPGVTANLCAAFSPEEAIFIFPLLPAVLLTILYWFRKTAKATQQTMSIPQ